MLRPSKLILMRRGLSFCFACVLIVSSCGGKSNSANTGATLSGNWQMVLTQTQPPPGTPEGQTESGFLTQSGTSLGGSILQSGSTPCVGLGTASGTVNGSNVTISVDQIGQTVSLNGTIGSYGATITGNYAILAAGCGSSTVGTFSATQIKPLSGNFQATFTSGEFSGSVYTFTGSLTQGQNSGASYGTLSGTMTSTNAPCSDSLSISGQVRGTSVVLNFLASDGSAQGQYQGTTSTDGTTLTGTYDFLAQSNGCYGDAGTVSIAFRPSSK